VIRKSSACSSTLVDDENPNPPQVLLEDRNPVRRRYDSSAHVSPSTNDQAAYFGQH
jgi:hypothetical protein